MNSTSILCRIAFALIALLSVTRCPSSHAEAGPPLIGDDPGTPERGHWEINTAFTLNETAHERVVASPLMDINYGVLDHLQFKLEVPWETTVTSDSGRTRGGLGAPLIGFKYRFLDEEVNKVSMSFYPQFDLGLQTLSWSHDPGAKSNILILPYQVEKTLGPFTVGLDFGMEFQNSQKPKNFIGLAAGHEFKERFELLAEIRELSGPSFRHMNLLVNGGFRLKINKTISLLGSMGTTFKRADMDQPRLFSYLGLQLKF